MMTTERWQQVEQLYHAALACEESQRAAFLIKACPADGALRRQVELLLIHDQQAKDFLESPALEAVAKALAHETEFMALSPGTKLGHYEILVLLGAGGMGEVYRARDPQLGRDVAIKVLPASFSRDRDRLRRFEQEARATAALNHPNILAVYQMGTHEGAHYLVSELLGGSTLRDHLLRGPVPVRKAVDFAIQTAHGLAAAHDQGIVHRDLKPENLFVTKDGRIKILDFGLAKLIAVPQASDPGTLTLTERTEPGVILGTVGYMSPEQVRGEELDARTDLFSFGATLYEMATGQRPFTGTTTALIFDAILHKSPTAPVRFNADLPAELERIINKALEKDRDLRYQDALDIRTDLKRLRRDASSERAEVAEVSPRRSRKLVLGTVAAISVLAGLSWFLLRRPAPPPPELTQKRLTFNSSGNPVESSAISPDGNYLAYSDPSAIHIKLLSTGEERLIPRPTGIPASAQWLVSSWFPDGTQLLADVIEPGGRSVWTVSMLGQSARKLRDGAGAWGASPDGEHIAFFPTAASGDKSEIWVMGNQGDNPQRTLASGENEWFDAVHWSPDGRRLAYIRLRRTTGGTSQGIAIETSDLTGAHRTVVLSNPELFLEDFCWLPDQRIIYSRRETQGDDDNLWQIAINEHTGTPIGKSKRLTQWPGSQLNNLYASRDGKRLVLQKTTTQGQVYVGELAAGGTRLNSPRRLTNDEAVDQVSAWMPDSKAVLFFSDRNGTLGIFKQGISEDATEPVTAGQKEAGWPRVSADGAWIFYVLIPRTS